MGQIDIRRIRFSSPYKYQAVYNSTVYYGNDYAYVYGYDENLIYPNKNNLLLNESSETNIDNVSDKIDIIIDSKYLVSNERQGNYYKLVFKNVDSNNIILNYYTLEFIVKLKDNKIYVSNYFFYTSEKNSSFKYLLEYKNLNGYPEKLELREFNKDLFFIENQSQANLKTTELIKYSIANTNFTKKTINNILSFPVYRINDYDIYTNYDDNKNVLFIFKAIGAISSDITTIYTIKKNYYRQGLLKQSDFISLPKLRKHFYIGRNKVNDDLISESFNENKGNVRIKQNVWKQAKYIESDNQI